MSIGSFFRKCFGLARDESPRHASLHPANKPQMRGPEASAVFMDEHRMMTKPSLSLQDHLNQDGPYVPDGWMAVQFLYSEFGDNLEFSGDPDWLNRCFGQKRIIPHFEGEDYWYLTVSVRDRSRPVNEAQRLVATIGPGDWILYNADRDQLTVNYAERATPND